MNLLKAQDLKLRIDALRKNYIRVTIERNVGEHSKKIVATCNFLLKDDLHSLLFIASEYTFWIIPCSENNDRVEFIIH